MKKKQILKKINKKPINKINEIINIIIILLILFLIFFVSRAYAQTKSEIIKYANIVSDCFNIPDYILPAIIQVESSFNHNSISKKNAVGLMQITPVAFCDYTNYSGYYISNFNAIKKCWKLNIWVGAWYLYRLHKIKNYSWKYAITSYFWGANNTNYTYHYYQKVISKIKKENIKCTN